MSFGICILMYIGIIAQSNTIDELLRMYECDLQHALRNNICYTNTTAEAGNDNKQQI